MTTIKRLAFAVALTLFALSINVSAQTPSIEVTTDGEAAQFSTQGKARSVRVEVFAPSGELVFEGDGLDGQAIEWQLRNQQGERVADGVYLATITVVDASGKRRKRIEQVTVGGQAREAAAAVAEASAPQESLAPTGSGTVGKIAKWTTATNLGNSVITESAGRIGVNSAASSATLQVNQVQPAPVANNAPNAPPLLQTTGGKGGNTTASGAVAGNGAAISLLAGNGGDAPSGSTRGSGGNIVLQPGSAGAGAGTGGASGNVLLAPSGIGNVAIGTTTSTSRLTVGGRVQTLGAGNGLTLGAGGNIKFADGSVQSKASNISGAGTANRLAKFTGPNSFGNSAITEDASGNVGIGVSGPIGYKLQVEGALFARGVNGAGVIGRSTYSSGYPESAGVVGQGVNIGVAGLPTSSSGLTFGVYGRGFYGVYGVGSVGVTGFSEQGIGVRGESKQGLAGSFSGNVAMFGHVGIGTGSFFAPVRPLEIKSGQLRFTSNSGDVEYTEVADQLAWITTASPDPNLPAFRIHSGSGVTPVFTVFNGGKAEVAGTLQVNGGSCTGCSPPSDRSLKANISMVNPRLILDRLASVPIQTWRYKSEPESVRHIGPMAQDFRAAFNFGTDDKTLNTVDAQGVTMASVQALYQLMLEKDRQIAQQNQRIERLEAQLNQVRRAVRGRRAAQRP